MSERIFTYIAADWDGDNDAVQKLYEWNESDNWGLAFINSRELHQSEDNGQTCINKQSLAEKLDEAKTFIFIAGNETKTRRAGSCGYCSRRNKNCDYYT